MSYCFSVSYTRQGLKHPLPLVESHDLHDGVDDLDFLVHLTSVLALHALFQNSDFGDSYETRKVG